MSATLRMADEKDAYIMADSATWLFNKDRIRLQKLVEGDKDLVNTYTAIAVSPYTHPYVKYNLAKRLIEWLVSEECQEMVDRYRIKGEQLFYTNLKYDLYN